MKDLLSRLVDTPLGAVLLGSAFFVWIFGTSILDPTHVTWLLSSGDAATHYLGWAFFRHEPWHWPLGVVRDYGIPEGTSVFYTDSIPLLALFLKPMRSFLPEPFQYFGFWILSCYILQGYFGWRLSTLVLDKPFDRLLLSAFFILSPILLNRGSGHHSLMAHWVLLAGLYLCIKESDTSQGNTPSAFPWKAWTLLLTATALIHAYLLAVLLVLYLSSCVSRLLASREHIRTEILLMSLPFLAVLAAMEIEGCFILSTHDWTLCYPDEYYHFSTNLLAPFFALSPSEPNGTFLHPLLMPTVPEANPYQAEGFNYLGGGVVMFLLVGMVTARKNLLGILRSTLRRHIPLSIALSLTSLFSITPVVTFGPYILVSGELPPALLRLADIFHAPGRFFWASCYVLLLFFILVLRSGFLHRPRLLTSVLVAGLVLQVVDLSPYHRWMREEFHRTTTFVNPFEGPGWADLFEGKKAVLYYPFERNLFFVPLGLLASDKGMGVNIAYRARYDVEALRYTKKPIESAWVEGTLRMDTAYITRDRALYDALKDRKDPRFVLRERDGFFTAYWKGTEEGTAR